MSLIQYFNERCCENDSVLSLSRTEYFNYLYVFIVSSLNLFLILHWQQHKKIVKFLKCPFLSDYDQVPEFAEVIMSVSFDPSDLWIRL